MPTFYCDAASCGFFIPSVESSTVPGVPLCGLCQSVCAALRLPTCIVLESRVVSGPVAAVSVWIRGWILTPQGLHGTTGPRPRDSQRFPAIRWDRQTDRQYGRKLETRLRSIDVPVLCGETLTYNSFRKPCSLKTLSL